MPDAKPKTAGVIAPPPLVLLTTLAAGLALDRLAGTSFEGGSAWRAAVGLGLFAAALGIVIPAAGRFRKAGTAVQPWAPSTVLVTDGIFARTRNPMYLGFVLVQLAAAMTIGGPVTLLLAIPLALVLHFGVVRREERYLAEIFGEDYAAYRARVRRYV